MERVQCRCPFGLGGSFPRPEGDAYRAEVGGATRLWRTTEDVRAPTDREAHEPCRHDRGRQLCLQQSAGNSTSPEVNVLFCLLGHRLLHQDIADLEAATRLEHASHLAQGGRLVRQ